MNTNPLVQALKDVIEPSIGRRVDNTDALWLILTAVGESPDTAIRRRTIYCLAAMRTLDVIENDEDLDELMELLDDLSPEELVAARGEFAALARSCEPN